MIRGIICFFAAFISIGCSATAEVAPYEVFQFNIPAGKYQFGAPEATSRLLSGKTVHGRVKLDECRVGEAFGAGFRFQFTSDDEKSGSNFGFSCVPALEQKLYSARSYGEGMPTHDAKEINAGVPSDWLLFSMQISGDEFITAFGGNIYRAQIPNHWAEAHFYAYCAYGIVEFYDPAANIS
jgi:hypothetical protein